eukprot:Hpha_TRINITY_DN33807_c0_g1::TRINITY_DN33807_c0_g1_i1::g.27498::m.27498
MAARPRRAGFAAAVVFALFAREVAGHLTYICSVTSPSVPGRMVGLLGSYHDVPAAGTVTQGNLHILSPDGVTSTGTFETFCSAGNVAPDNLDIAGIRTSLLGDCATTKDSQGRTIMEADSVVTCFIQSPWTTGQDSLAVTYGQGTQQYGPSVGLTVNDNQYTIHCCGGAAGGSMTCDEQVGGAGAKTTNLKVWYASVIDSTAAGTFQMWVSGVGNDLKETVKAGGSTPCGMKPAAHHYFDISVADGGNPCTSAPPSTANVEQVSVDYCDPVKTGFPIPSGFICSATCSPGFSRVGDISCLNGAWTSDFKCTNQPTCDVPGLTGSNNNADIDSRIKGIVGTGCFTLTEEATSCQYSCDNVADQYNPRPGLIVCRNDKTWGPGVGYVGCDINPTASPSIPPTAAPTANPIGPTSSPLNPTASPIGPTSS